MYCGSGVTACHNLLALEHAGLPGARLFPGSWSEWCARPDAPDAPPATEQSARGPEFRRSGGRSANVSRRSPRPISRRHFTTEVRLMSFDIDRRDCWRA